MFLFTTPALRPEGPTATPVVEAIRGGSERTGADFGYLLKTAQRESALDPAARAGTSSASGLFQFIEQTWLGLIKQAGPSHGLNQAAAAINETRSGRLDVADPGAKAQILALRNDPAIAAVMAGELTNRNAASLATALGHQPTQGELYVAHLMGAGGAADLIRKAQAEPRRNAAELFPEQAQANRGIFYDKASGKARSVSEVYAVLTAGGDRLAVPNVPRLPSDPAAWLATAAPAPLATAYAQQDGPALHGLFRTEGRRGPLNQTVEKLWSGTAARVASEGSAPRFFPRLSGPGEVVAAAEAPAKPANVPLPPERPADLAPVRRPGKPLDLTAFLKMGA